MQKKSFVLNGCPLLQNIEYGRTKWGGGVTGHFLDHRDILDKYIGSSFPIIQKVGNVGIFVLFRKITHFNYNSKHHDKWKSDLKLIGP